jgi:hypothetical protein
MERNKNLLSSDLWTLFQLRIFQLKRTRASSTKTADDVVTAAAVLWVALRTYAALLVV